MVMVVKSEWHQVERRDGIDITLEILEEIKDVFDECVVVHPSPYILKDDNDETNSTIDNFKSMLNSHIKSIEWINALEVFGVQSPTPLVILHYDKKFVFDSIDVDTLESFTAKDECYYRNATILTIIIFILTFMMFQFHLKRSQDLHQNLVQT